MVESTTSSINGDGEDGSEPWEFFLDDDDPEDTEDGPWAISLNGDEEDANTCELCDRPSWGMLCDECLENEPGKPRDT